MAPFSQVRLGLNLLVRSVGVTSYFVIWTQWLLAYPVFYFKHGTFQSGQLGSHPTLWIGPSGCWPVQSSTSSMGHFSQVRLGLKPVSQISWGYILLCDLDPVAAGLSSLLLQALDLSVRSVRLTSYFVIWTQWLLAYPILLQAWDLSVRSVRVTSYFEYWAQLSAGLSSLLLQAWDLVVSSVRVTSYFENWAQFSAGLSSLLLQEWDLSVRSVRVTSYFEHWTKLSAGLSSLLLQEWDLSVRSVRVKWFNTT
jgi:hypothetical protein